MSSGLGLAKIVIDGGLVYVACIGVGVGISIVMAKQKSRFAALPIVAGFVLPVVVFVVWFNHSAKGVAERAAQEAARQTQRIQAVDRFMDKACSAPLDVQVLATAQPVDHRVRIMVHWAWLSPTRTLVAPLLGNAADGYRLGAEDLENPEIPASPYTLSILGQELKNEGVIRRDYELSELGRVLARAQTFKTSTRECPASQDAMMAAMVTQAFQSHSRTEPRDARP